MEARPAASCTLSVGDDPVAARLDELPEDISKLVSDQWASATDAIAFLRAIASKGGPTAQEYALLTCCFLQLCESRVPFEAVRDALRLTLSTTDCMQGFGFLKPHGYAGDFEMIDKIYTFWKSDNPALRRWDEYFHLQPAPRAVRNRKEYFHKLLHQMKRQLREVPNIHVLNLGSGPARDIYEYLPESGNTIFDCIDLAGCGKKQIPV